MYCFHHLIVMFYNKICPCALLDITLKTPSPLTEHHDTLTLRIRASHSVRSTTS
jgi:hypothetical protein